MKKIFLFLLLFIPALYGQNVVNISSLTSSIENRKRIQAVEDSLSKSGGGTIYFTGLPSAIFHIDSTINKHGNVIWDGFSTIKQDTGVTYPFISINADSNIIIKNLTIDGGSTGWKRPGVFIIKIRGYSHDIQFQNVKFNNFKYSAINIAGVGNDLTQTDSTKNISLIGCTFNCNPNINYIAVYVSGCEAFTVKDCSFYNCNFCAVEFAGNPGYNKHALVSNNRFYMGKYGVFSIEGIGIMEEANIINNQSICSTVSGGGGISVHIRNSTVAHNHIMGGTKGNDRSGLEMFADNCEIYSNIIDNGSINIANDGTISLTREYSGIRSNSDTIFCNNNNIFNNTVKSIGNYAILMYYNSSSVAPPNSLDNNKIHDNILKSSHVAIQLGNTDNHSKISNLEIYNNIIDTDSSTFAVSGIGIKLQAPMGSHDIKIKNNAITNYTYGFIVDTANYTNLILEKNKFLCTKQTIYSARVPSVIIDRDNSKGLFYRKQKD